MSDYPQTFEDLRRMARDLPNNVNVFVLGKHIHSLINETERLIGRIADLKRENADLRAELDKVRKERDEAYERAAQAIRPGMIVEEAKQVLRALKRDVSRPES